jgi:capsular polysaccharide biosynthesis protein
MGNLIIGFVLGLIVATVGVSNLATYVDRQVDTAKEVIKENVK